jgi:beta-lactamase class A
MAKLLEQIYNREFVNREVSEEIERVLFTQQFKHKICGILGEEVPVAHKTGETSTITHDVGLVYAKQPFIVCFAGEDVNVPEFTSVISRKSEQLYKFCHK